MSNHVPVPSSAVTCPMCGKQNRADAARPFCTSCGARLAGGPSAAATPARAADVNPPSGGIAYKAGAVVLWLPALIVFLSLVTALPPLAVSLFMAIVVAILGGGGWMLWRAGDRSALRAREAWMERLQMQLMHLARSDPRLTVMEVSTRMGWPMPLAERVLNSLEDGMRVNMMPNDHGVMVYEFRELMDGRGEPPLLG